MVTLTYKNRNILLQDGESVLDALLESGESVPHACKQGICQTCLLKATGGEVPTAAQVGLKTTQKAQNYFLSCLCKPTQDLTFLDCDDLGMKATAYVIATKQLTPFIYAVWLEIEGDFSYKAGQYINLTRPCDQLTRSYSIAGVQTISPAKVELHIKVFDRGEMSNWLSSGLDSSRQISVRGPMGNCFYLPEFKEKNMLLLGYSTGLAPLYGMLQDALNQGHKGNIHLYHWGASFDDLYYRNEILALIKNHPNVVYKTGLEILEGRESERSNMSKKLEQSLSGDVCALIKEDLSDLKNWKIFLCGSEAKVNKARRVFYLAGADLSDIYADAFFTWQTAEVIEKVS